MPSLIFCGALNLNTAQTNAGSFIGEYNFSGWDANTKQNQGEGTLFGFFNFLPLHASFNIDNLEFADGVINDQDVKTLGAANV
ncbi:hypothetical protein GCM10025857_12030 [Alicyclobacillus contaminans]|uniref:hypothetical protein n=1 Tax=Alicyclobacillus contaminans TaxID=392016 RepID=UPI0004021405|nr:hypothetical protein [Alicyclobacillus contaminans]GMA49846.1 hypothetical protein GCM10025857_12030 [Alicyclobacillus contaminans]